MKHKCLSLLATLSLLNPGLFAHEDIFHLDPYEVTGRSNPLLGETIAAAQGLIHQVDLKNRPILRTGEILETIPGFIATQHSGTGKANQYFLRGFNLDHGTDFSTFIDGMPVNMPTHGHGQGWMDVNFLIPELIDSIRYMKGPYYASVGDFSSAGSSHISTVDSLPDGLLVLNVGEDSFYRGVFADSLPMAGGQLLAGYEGQYYDGPWDIGENFNKSNALVRWSRRSEDSRYAVTFMGYDATWDSADQIPLRAVESGLISELGSLDDDLGGKTDRYSLSADYSRAGEDFLSQANVYIIRYRLNLWSNFTYFLDDPVNGDEFEQVDDRIVYGANLSHSLYNQEFAGREMRQSFGFQFRMDDIDGVGLHRTTGKYTRLSTVREDDVRETTLGAFYENEIQWTDRFKSILGLRADYFWFDVDSNRAANSGKEEDGIVSPKLSLVYNVGDNMELFLSGGFSFHSNDARGTTITVDPTDGVTPTGSVDPLVRSKGAEIGSRMSWGRLNSSVAIWYLELDSELLFVGDAGITEPSRPSTRYGIEFANYYSPFKGLTFELDASFSESYFRDSDPAGDEIPGAIDTVLSAAVTAQSESGWVASARLRYFGPRPLVEDASVESGDSTSVNLRVGYEAQSWGLYLDVLNVFDSGDHDITYYYASRLPGEPAEGIEDIHYHPLEPRTARVYFTWSY